MDAITVDALISAPPRRFWMSPDGAIIYCAAIIGLVVGAVLKAKLSEWNGAGVRACISTGTAAAYCHNIEPYPIVLQWAYAAMAGWASFFVAWLVFTFQPRVWGSL